MIFHQTVTDFAQNQIKLALQMIEKYGNAQHIKTAKFIKNNDIEIYIGNANQIGGEGCAFIIDATKAQIMIDNNEFSEKSATKLLRICLAKEIFEFGMIEDLETTLIHEGKHARDYVKMLETFSTGDEKKIFNPTFFQHECSAHLTTAFYLMKRNQITVNKGLKLNFLLQKDKQIKVNWQGISDTLKIKYRLTLENPSYRISEISDNLKTRKSLES
jgi:hypothetical protein